MSRSLFLVVCIIQLFSNYLQAQTSLEVIDSLKTIEDQRRDTTLANRYNSISWYYRNLNTDSSLLYAQKGYSVSKEINYQKGLSTGLNYMGIAKRNKSNFTEAITIFFEALKISEEADDLTQISYTLVNIGNIHIFQTNFDGAFEYFEKALEIAEKLNDASLKAYCHINIGRSFIGLQEFDEAISHLSDAKRIREEIGDKEGVIIVDVEMANLYMKQEKYEEALSLLLYNLPGVVTLDHKITLAYAHINIATIYLKLNQYDSAFEYTVKCRDLCVEYGFRNMEMRTTLLLAEIYEMQKKPIQALETYKMYVQEKDSIFNEKNTREIATTGSQYDKEKNVSENISLKAQTEENKTRIKRQQTVIFLSAITTLLFLIIAVISFRSSAERKKLNNQIEKQKNAAYTHNNNLIDLNSEKNNLIRILSHDLRSPLNNIKGLTQIHQLDHKDQFSDSENKTLDLIKSESDRLLNMISKILNVETIDSQGRNIKIENVDVGATAHEVVTGMEKTAESKNINIRVLYPKESVYIKGDQIRFHQILENLLSNAIKFSEENKKIDLEVSKTDKKVQILCRDEGPGLSEDDKSKIFKKFQTLSAKPTGDEESTGLGLSIVKKYVTEMKGEIWQESTLGEGTTFYVEFDLATSDALDSNVS